MSLMDGFRYHCVMLNFTAQPDGAGGFRKAWREGMTFYPAIVEKTQTEPENGEKKQAKAFYEIYVPRYTQIKYHDVFRRLSDGRVFRVTSNPDDKRTPLCATFSFAVVTAEEWRLPDDENGSDTGIS